MSARPQTSLALLVSILLALNLAPRAPAATKLNVPPEAERGLHLLYNGDADGASELFRGLQRAQPEHPIGYLLEANARWWQIYCAACEIKWNMVDAWKRGKQPGDDAYLALADRAIALAEARLQQRHEAEMFLYAGMGYALKARLHGLRDERRATARAGVRAREHLINAAQMDPQLADAQTGLGLYNYYVDTLSAMARVLRFFMGIPGGSRKEGTLQLERAMASGHLTQAEARFYLAKNLRNYEQRYDRSVALLQPLVAQYPRNPVFHLLLGDFHAKLGHASEAAASYRTALALAAAPPAAAAGSPSPRDTPCAARIRALATQALAALASKDKK